MFHLGYSLLFVRESEQRSRDLLTTTKLYAGTEVRREARRGYRDGVIRRKLEGGCQDEERMFESYRVSWIPIHKIRKWTAHS